ncbi:MAG: ABC transporter ATP-binding protein/permease [Acidiphilium sp.]|nr:ABC transporter ATP-binding protein/permease [Acidiphilium sp.]MDD4935272.1 ABC transporter ATP-binding protein/permease [Acidiphilium sp.]
MKFLRNVWAALRDTWRLSKPYFQSDQKWRAYGLLAANLILSLITVYGVVLNTYWFRYSYDALQTKNAGMFWQLAYGYIRVKEVPYIVPGFLEIGVLLTAASVYAVYFTQMLEIRWRTWLTHYFVQAWLQGRAYYQISLTAKAGTALDNPDQRIADDVRSFVSNTLSLGLSFITNLTSIFSYIAILWSISGMIKPFGVAVPGYLVWIALGYSVLGTAFVHLIGRKLIPLTFQQQQVDADFRYNLVRVRENTEQIALYGGEAQEAGGLSERFTAIVGNWWKIMRRTKMLNFFYYGFVNTATFVGLVVAAPAFFAGAISLGALQQIGSAFGNTQGAFSWFVNSYQQIVLWRATVQRLDGFERAVRAAHRTDGQRALRTEVVGTGMQAHELAIDLPDGRHLFAQSELKIAPGTPIAITGPSGAGKSTLFRTLAGIWPFGHGQISRPAGQLMFLPQKPYFPLGSLKQAVAYPREAQEVTDAAVRIALMDVGLGELTGGLEQVDNWTMRLSGGEQQRLALARALIVRPDWLFLDEALSALDEPAALELFGVVRARLPATQIVSISHQASVVDLHPRRAQLTPDASGAMHLTDAAAGPGG